MKKIFVKDCFNVFRNNNDPIQVEDGYCFNLVGEERLVVVDYLEDSVVYKFHSVDKEFVFEVSDAFNWRNEDSFLEWMHKFCYHFVDFDFLKCFCTLEEIEFSEL